MTKNLTNKLDQLDLMLDHLVQQLQDLPKDTLQQRADMNRWSPMEILFHLYKAEGSSLAYLKKKLSFNPEFHKTSFREHMNGLVLKFYHYYPGKNQAPEYTEGTLLPPDLTLELLTKDWKEQRQAFRVFLNTLPKERFEQPVFKHPLVGRVSIEALVDFFRAHFLRHEKQLQRALKNQS